MSFISLPPAVRLTSSPEGFKRLEVVTPLATAVVYLYGAQVAAFTPEGAEPLLFFSKKSYFTPGKPMRGGAPVIFPWFGAHSADPAKPSHGFARTREWALEAATQSESGIVALTLRLDPDADATRWWPEAGSRWTLRHRITIGRELSMELEVQNRGEATLSFEEALHTYFAIRDICDVEITGLENADYLTVIEDQPRKNQGPGAIRFERETDRVYLSTGGIVEIREPHRIITVRKEGAASVIVWNPWSGKAAQLADMEQDEWTGMVCVETGNVKENSVELPPGGTHRSITTIGLKTV